MPKAAKQKITTVKSHPLRVPVNFVQDPKGESKNFIFRDVTQKDLLKPEIAIPIGIRWLNYKSERAGAKLGRPPTDEETILEYKGLLKSKSTYKDKALKSYRKYYEKLKKK